MKKPTPDVYKASHDLGIERKEVTVSKTILLPKGGLKTTKVVEKKISLARLKFAEDK